SPKATAIPFAADRVECLRVFKKVSKVSHPSQVELFLTLTHEHLELSQGIQLVFVLVFHLVEPIPSPALRHRSAPPLHHPRHTPKLHLINLNLTLTLLNALNLSLSSLQMRHLPS